MASNRLKLNPTKTDFIWCATHRRQHHSSKDYVRFAGSDIQPSSTVRGLGVILDSEISFGPHISQLVSRCFLQLRRIRSCVRALPMDTAKAIVNSFVMSRIDYCNSLLAGDPRYLLDRLQSVLNVAARLLVGAKKYDHISQVLRDRLHWLPVQQQVQFKLCLLTFKALHGLAPTYLADLCQPVASVGSRQRLRSATRGDLVVSPTVTHFGAQSFAVAGPKAWNHLPADIRAIDTVGAFKTKAWHHLPADIRAIDTVGAFKTKAWNHLPADIRAIDTVGAFKTKAWNHLPADIRAIDTVGAFKTALKTFLFRNSR